MGKLVVWIVGWALKRNLTIEERNKIVVHILTSLQAAPLTDIITVSEEGIKIGDKFLDMEQATLLREASMLALNNRALKLIREQVTYVAFVLLGIKADDAKSLLFARAALWWGQQEEFYLQLLAQKKHTVEEEPDL